MHLDAVTPPSSWTTSGSRRLLRGESRVSDAGRLGSADREGLVCNWDRQYPVGSKSARSASTCRSRWRGTASVAGKSAYMATPTLTAKKACGSTRQKSPVPACIFLKQLIGMVSKDGRASRPTCRPYRGAARFLRAPGTHPGMVIERHRNVGQFASNDWNSGVLKRVLHAISNWISDGKGDLRFFRRRAFEALVCRHPLV